MKRGSDKDLYSIMGVEPDSSPEEIRAAYLARARVLHPDRFDQQRQPQDWKNANGMMAELNEAYVILHSPSSRAEYDLSRAGTVHRWEDPPPASHEFGEPSPGSASFAELPAEIQSKLIRRQNNVGMEQYQVRLDSVVGNFAFTALLACWFCWLYADAGRGRWEGDALLWRCGATLAVGFMIALNLVRIRRWMKATLTSCFYVTPLYFIRTEYDIVSYRPIWMLRDVAIAHHRKTGLRRSSSVVFKFDGHNESISLPSRRDVETLFERLRHYDARLRVAYANRDEDYIRKNDDFIQTQRAAIPTGDLLPGWRRVLIHMAALALCGVGFCGAVAVNEGLSHKQWVSHAIQRVVETVAQDRNLPQFISGTAQSILQDTNEATRMALVLALFLVPSLIGARIAGRNPTGPNLGQCTHGKHDAKNSEIPDDEVH